MNTLCSFAPRNGIKKTELQTSRWS